jgi:hypothetical protein
VAVREAVKLLLDLQPSFCGDAVDLLSLRAEQNSHAVLAAVGNDSRERPGVNGLILRIPEFILDRAVGAVVLPAQPAYLGSIMIPVGNAGQPEQQADCDQ